MGDSEEITACLAAGQKTNADWPNPSGCYASRAGVGCMKSATTRAAGRDSLDDKDQQTKTRKQTEQSENTHCRCTEKSLGTYDNQKTEVVQISFEIWATACNDTGS